MTASDGLAPDQPLPDAEIWLRELTNSDYLKADGTVHYQGLKGRAIQAPQRHVSWSHELSGRAHSLAADIRGHAEASAERARQGFLERGKQPPSKIRFVGVAFAKAVEIRDGTAPTKVDTVFTPNEDPAHADLVCYSAAEDSLDELRDWLITKLKTARLGELEKVTSP